MARAVFYGFPLTGHINPSLQLVRTLADRGEEIHYYATEPYREGIERAGAAFRAYPSLLEEPEEPLDGFSASEDGIEAFALWVDSIYRQSRSFRVWGLNETWRVRPDYMLFDSMCPGAKSVAGELGIPGVSSCTTFALNGACVDADPALIADSLLRVGGEDNGADAAFIHRLLGKIGRQLSVKYGDAPFHPLEMLSATGDVTIVYTSGMLQLCREAFDGSYRFVGPSFQSGRTAPVPDTDAWLPEGSEGRPLVYVSLGTLFNRDLSFYRSCIEALQPLQVRVVMSVGRHVDPHELGGLPAAFVVRQTVDQPAVLAQADLFITHGGFNSVNEGLYYGVPLLVCPQAVDQFLSAAQVARLGAGLAAPERSPGPDMLGPMIGRLLDDPSFRSCAAAVGRSLREAGGMEEAAGAIFAATGRGVPAS